MNRPSSRNLIPFLASEYPPAPEAEARFHVLIAPLEATVSWKTGAARGPFAVLEASWQLEAWDGRKTPGDAGIWTCPRPICDETSASMTEAMDRIASAVAGALSTGAVPVVLGGEHTVAAGAVRGCMEAHGGRIGVVQFDAHADLRDEYHGTRWSHACTAHRILDAGPPLLQIGVRSLSLAEHRFREANPERIAVCDAETIARGGPQALTKRIPADFPEDAWITFDVDVFDPSLMPAVGTPEPGGLFWWNALDLLRTVCRSRRIIGFDVCELAPREGLHHCEYTVARLVYFLMGLTVS